MSTAFRIEMDSAQEVPPTTSTASGLGTVVFDSTAVTASYNITVAGLDFGEVLGTGDQTPDPNDDVHGIHVHNADRGVNGDIVFGQLEPAQDDDDFLIAANPDGSTTFSGVWETTDPANSSINNFAATLGSATLGSEVALYWNIHTEEFSSGAIRGQWVCIATDNSETVNGTDGDDILPGLGGNDAVIGGLGDDTLDGGTGDDTMLGGAGNDTYVVEDAGDVASEAGGGGGTDTVQSSLSFTLGTELENLTLTGSANINGTGNDLANVIVGNAGNNALDGGIGADAMTGGLGDDTYVVDDAGDTTVEGASGGTDTVQSWLSLTLGTELENLTLTGSANINGTGNDLANVIVGNAGNNALDGGIGADAMTGGLGDDVFQWDPGDGNDTVEGQDGTDTLLFNGSSGDEIIAISANGERVLMTRNLGNITMDLNDIETIDHNALGGADLITVNDLSGTDIDRVNIDLAGTIGGSAGDAAADTVVINGTNGDDIITLTLVNGDLVVSGLAADVVVENFETTDTIRIVGLGGNDVVDASALGAGGPAIAIDGGDGDDIMLGGAGADAMTGGLGDDTYVVDDAGDTTTEAAGGGTDTVQSAISLALAAELENLTLTGSAAINATGNDAANTLTGNTAANTLDGLGGNDRLDGGADADTMRGGAGNDTYVVDNVGDVVSEIGGGGSDTVEASVTFDLGAGVNNLTLTGTASINGTGNNAANTLLGNSGNNRLNGSGGADTMAGGAGDDIYVVDNTGDVVSEDGGGGLDTVQSSITFALGGGFNNLTLTGTANINGTGTGSDNVLKGNTGRNTLDGGSGEDALNGGDGNDTLIGGADADIFVFGDSDGDDLVTDFEDGSDKIDLTAVDDVGNFGDLDVTDTGPGVLIDYGNGTIELDNVARASSISANDFIFA